MPRKTVKTRVFTIAIPPGTDIEKLYDRVAKAMKTGYGEAWVEKGRLYVRLTGTDYELRTAWARIKEAVSELWSLYSLEARGETSIEGIVREIRATFPPDALVEALRLQGYRAELGGEGPGKTLSTNAPAEKVLETAKRVAEAVEEVRFRVRGSNAKKLVAAAAAGLGRSVEEVIEYGLRLGVLGVDEEERVYLREEWRRALKKLALVLGGEDGARVSTGSWKE